MMKYQASMPGMMAGQGYSPAQAQTPAAGRAGLPGVPSGPGNEALSFDVTEADFRQKVIEKSMTVPVLLDCWAPWCGPCRNLGPVLERLAQAYEGRFVLAKLNTDEAPQISAALQIRSIPHVVLIVGGRPVDQFNGALPEGQIRQFLDKHLGPQVSEVDLLREQAAQAPDEDTAFALLQQALHLEPRNPELLADVAERLLATGDLEQAMQALEAVPADQRGERHAAIAKRLALASHKPDGDAEELTARISANAKDFEARFALAKLHAHAGHFQAAFDQLLEVVMRDKAEWREKARVQLVEWFQACPDADVVSRGRRYLGMYLN
jgi:putative thioredoxin